MKKLGLLLVVGCLVLAVGFSFAENCDKEVAKTYVKIGSNFIEISALKSLTCPKPQTSQAKVKTGNQNFYFLNQNISKKEKILITGKALVLKAQGIKMPGDCKSIKECEAYCFADTAHMEECLKFAEEYNLLPKSELEEGKRIVEALAKKGGFRPPTCLPGTECL